MTNTEPTIEDQLKLEKSMIDRGIDRYETSIKTAQDKGREHETQYGSKLTREFILPLAEAIRDFCAETRAVYHGSARSLVASVLPEQAAFIGIRRVLAGISRTAKLTSVAADIGNGIEGEARFSRFRETNRASVDTVLQKAKERGSVDLRYIHRVLTHMANEHHDKWTAWTIAERIRVGSIIVELIERTVDLIEIKKSSAHNRTVYYVNATDTAIKWMQQSIANASVLRPIHLPCIIPPADWEDLRIGGYWNVRMRSNFPLVKFRGVTHARYIEKHPMQQPRAAISTIQKTPWRINKGVHDVMIQIWEKNLRTGMPPSEPLTAPDCPFDTDQRVDLMSDLDLEIFRRWKREAAQVYSAERERKSKCMLLMSVLRMAAEFREYSKIYFPIQADFRGRMYSSTPGLSPQGPNFGKGMLEFAEGKPLGKDGEYWFLAAGAGLLGYDKVSYDDRVQHILGMKDILVRAASDPIGYREVWGEADKPWQFLAWLLEFRKYCSEGESMVSHIPLGLDGSCNGLQHFSAMLRDEVGGKATNLVPGDKPSDIYAAVAERVKQRLAMAEQSIMRDAWLEFGIDRKLVKRPVMTLPYGSTQRSCVTSLLDVLHERKSTDFESAFKASMYLTPIVWDSIGDVVVAAREAMAWLRASSRVLAKEGQHVEWVTPTGFPVYMRNTKFESIQVKTILHGGVKLRARSVVDTVDPKTQQSGCSPNFVHSMDASHLTRTVIAAAKHGITDFACIHDDFGTHAANTKELHTVLREEFVRLYDNDVLAQFKEQNEARTGINLPDLPRTGNLDLNEVRNSRYFFG